MPGRKIPLINNQIYHVLNRGVASQPIFLNESNYERAQETLFYYQNTSPTLGYSQFLRLSLAERKRILEGLRLQKKFLVEIIVYCLMPNHFHILLKQVHENGISTFLSNFTNSYTRYFNSKNKRIGHIFQGKFKAIRIETDEQLLHVSRYIHLNPYSSFVVKNLNDLRLYPYSSLPEYLDPKSTDLCQKKMVLDNFRKFKTYQKFLADQANYQRELENIKHLLLEINT